MVAPEETRSSRRPEADGADDRALLKPNDTEETPLEGGFSDAARPSGYRRITTLALCFALTVSVVGLRRISMRPASGVASLSAQSGAASPSKLSGAESLEVRWSAPRTAALSKKESSKEKKSVREDDDDFHASKKESFSTYSYSYGGDTALLEPGDGDDEPKFNHPPRDLGDDFPNTPNPSLTPSPTTLLPYPMPTLTYKPTGQPSSAMPTSASPSGMPVQRPTPAPSEDPTFCPTSAPTIVPSPRPSRRPTNRPTTATPSYAPSDYPTHVPTLKPCVRGVVFFS